MRQEDKSTAPVQEHVDAVNAAIAGKAGELVLLHWNGSDEAIGRYNNLPGFKTKQWFEGWHIAVAVLDGKPIHEEQRGPHWIWQLSTLGPFRELLVWPHLWGWHKENDSSPVGDSGAYPSLEEAEPLPTDELGCGPLGPRRAQVLIGADAIQEWLKHNRHTGLEAANIFRQILKHTGQKQVA